MPTQCVEGQQTEVHSSIPTLAPEILCRTATASQPTRRAVNDVIHELDMQGRPAIEPRPRHGSWAKPLGSVGRHHAACRRHPTKMAEPTAASDALHRSPDLRAMLAVAASINGDDFVPYNVLIVGRIGRDTGLSPAWRHPRLLPADVAVAGVVPGSHHHGKADIKAMVAANGGSDMIDAVPLVCGAGDVTIANRDAADGDHLRIPRACSGSPASSPTRTRSESLIQGHRCRPPPDEAPLSFANLPTTTGTRARRSIRDELQPAR